MTLIASAYHHCLQSTLVRLLLLMFLTACGYAQQGFPEGFSTIPHTGEQLQTLSHGPDIRVCIIAPASEQFNPNLPVHLVFYALPNGSSLEETIGKKVERSEDHKFGIQQIGAQTRFIRDQDPPYNLVVIYLANRQKSWPAWKVKHPQHATVIATLIDQVRGLFSGFDTQTILNGHSGGGRLIFSYLDHAPSIPDHVQRIAFLDSDYGYEPHYGKKLTEWLERNDKNRLVVMAYNDSVALYEGKPFVTPTGGTWYRSKMLLNDLSPHFEFLKKDTDSLLWYYTPERRIEIILKTNPNREIFHTEQVEYNGFIHSLFSGTTLEEKRYKYFGPKAYKRYLSSYPVRTEPN